MQAFEIVLSLEIQRSFIDNKNKKLLSLDVLVGRKIQKC